MTIYFKVGGMLRERLRPDVDEYTRKVETDAGLTIREILERIGLKSIHVAMAFTGERLITLSYVPHEGDVITLRPPVQGG